MSRLIPFYRRKVEFSGPHPHASFVGGRDTFVASFPRSGNTWLRLLLSDLVLQSKGYKTGTKLPIHQDEIIPDFDQRADAKMPSTLNLDSRLLKTHWQHFVRMRRVLFVFRLPASCLTSYYHFHLRYPERVRRAAKGLEHFCRRQLPSWQEHATSYLAAAQRCRQSIKFISYEQLWSEPETTLRSCADWLHLDVSRDQVRVAVYNHSFEKQRQLESSTTPLNGEYFFRQGKIDSAKEELSPECYAWIQSETKLLLEALDARCERTNDQNLSQLSERRAA